MGVTMIQQIITRESRAWCTYCNGECRQSKLLNAGVDIFGEDMDSDPALKYERKQYSYSRGYSN